MNIFLSLDPCPFVTMATGSRLIDRSLRIDHIANLQNDAWWEGRGIHLMHCGKDKDEIYALDLPTMHHSGH